MEDPADEAVEVQEPTRPNVAAALLGLQLGVVGGLLFLATAGTVPTVAGIGLIVAGLFVGVAAASG